MSTASDVINQLSTDGLSRIVLWVLGLASLLLVVEATGMLPLCVSKWLNRNRLRETIRLLKEFGINAETSKRANDIAELEQVSGTGLTDRVRERLKGAMINHQVTIGTQIPVVSTNYIDLMGATCDRNVAMAFARDLTALWRSLACVGGTVAHADIDFIVVPKTGSPLLGACFAELLKKPLLLHNHEPKFRPSDKDPKARFDFCCKLPTPGSRGLMVDDSTTGGGKAESLVNDLRHFGWEVSDFLVIFEPQLKISTQQTAAQRLKPKGVTVHSITKT